MVRFPTPVSAVGWGMKSEDSLSTCYWLGLIFRPRITHWMSVPQIQTSVSKGAQPKVGPRTLAPAPIPQVTDRGLVGAQVPAKEAKLLEAGVLVNDVQELMNRKVSSIISSQSNKCTNRWARGEHLWDVQSRLMGHDVLSGLAIALITEVLPHWCLIYNFKTFFTSVTSPFFYKLPIRDPTLHSFLV